MSHLPSPDNWSLLSNVTISITAKEKLSESDCKKERGGFGNFSSNWVMPFSLQPRSISNVPVGHAGFPQSMPNTDQCRSKSWHWSEIPLNADHWSILGSMSQFWSALISIGQQSYRSTIGGLLETCFFFTFFDRPSGNHPKSAHS